MSFLMYNSKSKSGKFPILDTRDTNSGFNINMNLILEIYRVHLLSSTQVIDNHSTTNIWVEKIDPSEHAASRSTCCTQELLHNNHRKQKLGFGFGGQRILV
jgi:hypothetical protein